MSEPVATCGHGIDLASHCALCLRDHPQGFDPDDDCTDPFSQRERVDVAFGVLKLHCGGESDAVTGSGRLSTELVEAAEKVVKDFIEGK